MAKTLQQKFADALAAKGEVPAPTRAMKYWCYTRKEGGYYFLGKSGSLRFGLNKTGSIPCSSKFKNALLGVAEPVRQEATNAQATSGRNSSL